MVYNRGFQHLYYNVLIDLCTYPNGHDNFRNILFPPGISQFSKITTFKSYNTYESDDSSKIFESSFFRALVKFKWHVFARLRPFGMFLFYLINSCLFVASMEVFVGIFKRKKWRDLFLA